MPTAARSRRNTIADAVHRAAAQFGDRPALAFGDRSWSFRELDLAAGRIAHHLRRLGLAAGDRVAAYGRNSDAYFLLWLACTRAGLVHVPVNFALTGDELTYIITQSGAAAMLSDAALDANLAPVRALGTVRHFLDFASLPAVARDPAMPHDLDADLAETDLAQLLYTSGTTAQPKGAAMSHAALLAEYTSCIIALELTAADRSIAALPLYHSAQMHCFLMPSLLVGGYSLLCCRPRPPMWCWN
jgi:fatty-acyl-CoA synthase